jgi:putative flippase GtrA
MTGASAYDPARKGRRLALRKKAVTFALIGVINTLIDYSVFLFVRAALSQSPAALAEYSCNCSNATTISLVAANAISWIVAVSASYVMNSSITFAAESGRKLRWRAYFTFIISGIAGWLANTATLVVAAEVLLMPVWMAKALAVLASFVVNFSLSHFVVFRAR